MNWVIFSFFIFTQKKDPDLLYRKYNDFWGCCVRVIIDFFLDESTHESVSQGLNRVSDK